MTIAGSGANGCIISTVVGTGEQGFAGDGGPAANATLDNPFDLAFDGAGHLYFADTQNHRIRRVDARSGVITTIAGNGEAGFAGDGGPATAARLHEPYGVAVDAAGNVYIVDRFNFRVRRVDAGSGVITTVAGNGEKAHCGDGGAAVEASLLEPNDAALSPDGRLLYIADPSDHRVRVVDLSSGIIDTFAGNGAASDSGDGGAAGKAGVWGARAIAVASDGTVYIVKKQGVALRIVEPGTGIIGHLAGTGEHGFADGALESALFDRPKELCMDGDEAILVVDTEAPAIRRIDLRSRTVSTVAGVGDGRHHFTGDGVPAIASSLARPHGVTVGPDGAVYIGDSENHRIRKVSRAPR